MGNFHASSNTGEGDRFWGLADEVVRSHTVVIDRPAGSTHPRFPSMVYPIDYGYLQGTTALDGGGIDCWVGSLSARNVNGVIITVDTLKSDTELKWLIGCTDGEMESALATHRNERQAAMLVPRPGENVLPR